MVVDSKEMAVAVSDIVSGPRSPAKALDSGKTILQEKFHDVFKELLTGAAQYANQELEIPELKIEVRALPPREASEPREVAATDSTTEMPSEEETEEEVTEEASVESSNQKTVENTDSAAVEVLVLDGADVVAADSTTAELVGDGVAVVAEVNPVQRIQAAQSTATATADKEVAEPDMTSGKKTLPREGQVVEQQTERTSPRAEFVENSDGAEYTNRVFKVDSQEKTIEDPLKAFRSEDGELSHEKLSTFISMLAEKDTALPVSVRAVAAQPTQAAVADIRPAAFALNPHFQSEAVVASGSATGAGGEGLLRDKGGLFSGNVGKEISREMKNFRETPELSARTRHEVVERLKELMQNAANNRAGTTMVVRLDPPELGAVMLKIVHRGDQIYARMVPESKEVENVLRYSAPEMVRAIAQSGIHPDNIHVGVGEEAKAFGSDLLGRHFEGSSGENASRGQQRGEVGVGHSATIFSNAPNALGAEQNVLTGWIA